MVRLERVQRTEETGKLVAVYKATHSTPGRDGTTLDFEIRVQHSRHSKKYYAEVAFDGCDGTDPMSAIRRLGAWCDRAAEAIRTADLGATPALPLGENDS